MRIALAPGENHFDEHRRTVEAVVGRGERPTVVLQPFEDTAPADRWLELDSPERFAAWAGAAVDALADVCDTWITVDQPNRYVLDAYVTARRPPAVRMGTGYAIRALDNLVAGHALAYRTIKDRLPDATVGLATHAYVAYEIDRLVLDLLVHRSRGVSRSDLHEHLVARRRSWYAHWPRPSMKERLVRHYTKSGVPLELAFPRAQAAIAAAAERPLDTVHVVHGGLDAKRYDDAARQEDRG